MEPTSAKRRKIEHAQDVAQGALAAAGSTAISRTRAFILESEELLGEVSLDYATAFEGADNLLQQIKASIDAIKPHEPLSLTDAASKLEKKHKVHVPFPNPRPAEDSNYKVAFAQPAHINVTGSYISKTMIKTQRQHALDMVVVMPADILQEKDYLDFRYFYKRAYYLAIIAVAVQKELGGKANLSYEYLNGNQLCRVLSVQPKAPSKKAKADNDTEESKGARLDYRIRVIPCAPDNFFPKTKLHVGAALIRKGHDEATLQPTPFYNSALIAEGCYLQYLKLLRQTEKKCAAFKKACILGRIWLQQRGFSSDVSEGGFGQFEWAVVLALLLQGGSKAEGQVALSTSLSATQLFKALVQFLSVTNLAENPCVLGAGNANIEDASVPVIYDSARQLNIAFKMSSWSAAKLYQHARWTRSLLSDPSVDQFTPTFILKADLPFQSYDLVAQLNYDATSDKKSACFDSRGKAWEFSNGVYKTLQRALADPELGERTKLIHINIPKQPTWPLTKNPSSPKNRTLEIGVLFDPANMSRTVDRGPAAGATAEEKEECEKFRRFWGEKAELRRFERDTIRETVIWNTGSSFEICEEIMRYILRLHHGIGHLEGELTFRGNGFAPLIPLKPTDTGVYNAAKKAFSSFERDVRNLEDLPLHVRHIQPICPELRHTSVKLPFSAASSKSGPQPMEAVISFEASGKWPESLAAIQRTKIAFLLMIGSLLEKSKPEMIKTYVGLEDAETEIENLAFLDVIYESGAAFRLRIQSDLEETLLERQAKDKLAEQHVRQRAANLLAVFRRMYTQLPLQNQVFSTFATRFPALSGTIRLLKHWFDAHKLSCHFTEEFIELVALHVFLQPYPWSVPSSAGVGLLRALLFLANWDWRTEALIIDTTGGEMEAKERKEIETRMEAWRKIDPGMNHTVLFVATANGEEGGTGGSGVAFTTVNGEARPSKVVAARMTALAKSACRVVKEEGLDIDVRRLFVGSVREYDALIKLSGKAVKGCLRTYAGEEEESHSSSKGKKFKNLDERTTQDVLPVARHPGDVLLKELNDTYGGVLVFFRGAADDTSIGAIWNPLMKRRAFKVNLPGSYKPVAGDDDDAAEEEENFVEVNREAILAEIARVGGDLIEKIDVRGE